MIIMMKAVRTTSLFAAAMPMLLAIFQDASTSPSTAHGAPASPVAQVSSGTHTDQLELGIEHHWHHDDILSDTTNMRSQAASGPGAGAARHRRGKKVRFQDEIRVDEPQTTRVQYGTTPDKARELWAAATELVAEDYPEHGYGKGYGWGHGECIINPVHAVGTDSFAGASIASASDAQTLTVITILPCIGPDDVRYLTLAGVYTSDPCKNIFTYAKDIRDKYEQKKMRSKRDQQELAQMLTSAIESFTNKLHGGSKPEGGMTCIHDLL